MANKKLDLIEKEVNALLEKIEADKAEATRGIENALTALEDAENNVSKAFDVQNMELYKKNTALKHDAEVGLSMYQKKLEQLNNTTYITEEEFNKFCSDIFAELNKEVEDGRTAVLSAIDSLFPIRDNLLEDIKKANKLLKAIQVDIYKDEKYNNASPFLKDRALKKFDDYALVQFIGKLESMYMYQQMKSGN